MACRPSSGSGINVWSGPCGDLVRRSRCQIEAAAAVVQQDAGVAGDDAEPKSEERLDSDKRLPDHQPRSCNGCRRDRGR